MDREKVIKELVNLPITVHNGFYQLRITHDLRDEIVKLLKEQEKKQITLHKKHVITWGRNDDLSHNEE